MIKSLQNKTKHIFYKMKYFSLLTMLFSNLYFNVLVSRFLLPPGANPFKDKHWVLDKLQTGQIKLVTRSHSFKYSVGLSLLDIVKVVYLLQT